MKCFYSVPTTTLETTPPSGIWHGTQCPGVPALSLCVVERWNSHAEQDAWEALPGVKEHYIENWSLPVPAAVVTAFGPWGVTATDTLRQAMQKIRAQWPPARL